MTADEVLSAVAGVVAASDERVQDVAELVNVDHAGPLFTTTEPARIAESVPLAVQREFGLQTRVVIAEAELAPVVRVPTVTDVAPVVVETLVAATGALERDAVSLAVWQCVAQAVLDREVPVSTLRALANAWPEVLVLEAPDDGSGLETVRFVNRAAHRLIRASHPIPVAAQQAITTALLELHARRPDTLYTTWALPTHVALADDIEGLLREPALLATVHWYGLWSALATAYPNGVPGGGTAADVHFLHAQGVRPGTQGEWVAWLHHAAVSRGDRAMADALVGAVTAPLPWRTIWSRWRLPGGPLVAYPGHVGVQEIRADTNDVDRPLVAEWREIAEAPPGETAADNGGGVRYVYERWRRDAWTGQPVDGPTRVVSAWPKRSAGNPMAEVSYASNHRGAWQRSPREPATDVPRMPEAVRQAVRLSRDADGAELWAFAGYGGQFAALVDPKAVESLPRSRSPWTELFLPGPLTSAAPWPLPADIPRTDDEVTRNRLERADAFREGACRPMAPASLPDLLTHEPSRRFLTEIGWPHTRVIGGLYAPDLEQQPLTPSPDHPGMVEGLGQLASWTLYLDGSSGVVHVVDDGETVPVASSLPRLLALVLLDHLVLSTSLTSSELESEVLSESVPAWFAALDPLAADSPAWEGLFEDLEYESEDYATLLDELDASAPR
ncbi:SUKH-4 family immunity protein [Streptomyces sp. NPDC006422]|uniref:SUKH-4 family immunity protein n=1 Tax=unclassified Streptomyces TaxID=2593676 RepID=UPI00339EA399